MPQEKQKLVTTKYLNWNVSTPKFLSCMYYTEGVQKERISE